MLHDHPQSESVSSGVTLAFVLAAEPTRATAFRTAMTAVLHAGFSFGQDQPGQLVYSYDAQGDHYVTPPIIPAGSITELGHALTCLDQIAHHYNQSISLGFVCSAATVPVTGRVYDEADSLVITLDFACMSWRRFVAAHHSPRIAAVTLLATGRTLFTLLPLAHLLIGPSTLLLALPARLDQALLDMTPIVMLAAVQAEPLVQSVQQALHVEHLPRGPVFVRQWDVSKQVILDHVAQL